VLAYRIQTGITMKEIFFLVEEAEEGGYIASAIGQSIVTEADTLDELKTNIREAVDCHFEAGETPHIAHLHFVKDEVLSLV
jgi:predicted RNase H-like HicB family nuclease